MCTLCGTYMLALIEGAGHHTARVELYTGLEQTWCVMTGAGYKLVQTSTHWYKLVRTGLNWVRLGQTGSDWFRLVQTGSGWFRLVQTGSDWFRLIHTALIYIL